MHSAKGLMMSAAGLRPVEGIAGVTNVDLSSIVDSHDAYLEKMPEVLAHLGLVESLHG